MIAAIVSLLSLNSVSAYGIMGEMNMTSVDEFDIFESRVICGNRPIPFMSPDAEFHESVPYTEFSSFTAFYTKIDIKNKQMKEDEHKQRVTAHSYDGLNAYYYNLDCQEAAKQVVPTFDINFTHFFLSRFLYFLDLIKKSKSCAKTGAELVKEKCCTEKKNKEKMECNECLAYINKEGKLVYSYDDKPVDLYWIPEKYADLHVRYNNAQEVLNTVLCDSVIRGLLVTFIDILMKQVETHAKNYNVKVHPRSVKNTYQSYISTLEILLNDLKKISVLNHTKKYRYINNGFNYTFAAIPVFEKSTSHVHYPIVLIPSSSVDLVVVSALCQ
jgi:hypothetical protein